MAARPESVGKLGAMGWPAAPVRRHAQGLQRQIRRAFAKWTNGARPVDRSVDIDGARRLIAGLKPVATDCPLIRLGGDSDGGYLVPDDLDGVAVSISPGVSGQVSFDLDLAARGIHSYMADASVDGPPVANARFHFRKRFLDVVDGPETLRLETLCAQIDPDHDGDRLLQMDIEGAEYPILLDTGDAVLKSFRIMVIEFHALDRMFNPFDRRLIAATFRKLLRNHRIVHIHPNNCCPVTVLGDIAIPKIMEFTFHRQDRARPDPNRKPTIPHPLDRKNLKGKPDLALPACWY